MEHVEFQISLSSDGRAFIVYDRCKEPAQHARMRAALEQHRDNLRERLIDIDRILTSDEPERSERLMIDDAMTRVDRIVLRANSNTARRDVNFFLEAMPAVLARRDTDRNG